MTQTQTANTNTNTALTGRTTLINQNGKRETLCWTCKHCTGSCLPETDKNTNTKALYQCPWVRDYTPVEGWTATRTELKVAPDQKTESYFIHSCPHYKMDLEGQIDVLSAEDLSKAIGFGNRYAAGHMEFCKKVLYTLISQKSRRLNGRPYTKKTRYQMVKDIIGEILVYDLDEITDIENTAKEIGDNLDLSPSDANKYLVELRAEVKHCEAGLSDLKYHYTH